MSTSKIKNKKPPFPFSDEQIRLVTETAQAICRENYPDYMVHESDVLITLKALSVVIMAINKAPKKTKTGKGTQKKNKRHSVESSLVYEAVKGTE